ncbi:hypothetical protein GDO78_013699 [Eleutherodactylus coqui]|uniref:Uncharacterized protein n=1 Tax=Eleutherodactylus coqui TaxID=57060 RepID=A0A8J6E4J1_ELECQ|nr:hypothetical protein GDO78_013699 [Eleutherodactylus coqui]
MRGFSVSLLYTSGYYGHGTHWIACICACAEDHPGHSIAMVRRDHVMTRCTMGYPTCAVRMLGRKGPNAMTIPGPGAIYDDW